MVTRQVLDLSGPACFISHRLPLSALVVQNTCASTPPVWVGTGPASVDSVSTARVLYSVALNAASTFAASGRTSGLDIVTVIAVRHPSARLGPGVSNVAVTGLLGRGGAESVK